MKKLKFDWDMWPFGLMIDIALVFAGFTIYTIGIVDTLKYGGISALVIATVVYVPVITIKLVDWRGKV